MREHCLRMLFTYNSKDHFDVSLIVLFRIKYIQIKQTNTCTYFSHAIVSYGSCHVTLVRYSYIIHTRSHHTNVNGWHSGCVIATRIHTNHCWAEFKCGNPFRFDGKFGLSHLKFNGVSLICVVCISQFAFENKS